MALITDYLVQGGQMLLILLLAPLLTGWVRAIKARLLRRRGPSLLQPYRDLLSCCARTWCWPNPPPGCSGLRPI